MTSKFDLIIFDCDGTLVDTEVLNNASTSEVLTEAGFPQYTVEYCLDNFVGTSQARLWQAVRNDTGYDLPADINQRYIDRVQLNLNRTVHPTPKIERVLQAVSQTHKICVGSNGERPNVVGALQAAGLLKFFTDKVIFTVEDVVHPKPAPDLYEHVASIMGAKPDRCLVIEDSILGATAGIAAGMKVFGYTGLAHDPVLQASRFQAVGVHITSGNLIDILTYMNE